MLFFSFSTDNIHTSGSFCYLSRVNLSHHSSSPEILIFLYSILYFVFQVHSFISIYSLYWLYKEGRENLPSLKPVRYLKCFSKIISKKTFVFSWKLRRVLRLLLLEFHQVTENLLKEEYWITDIKPDLLRICL